MDDPTRYSHQAFAEPRRTIHVNSFALVSSGDPAFGFASTSSMSSRADTVNRNPRHPYSEGLCTRDRLSAAARTDDKRQKSLEEHVGLCARVAVGKRVGSPSPRPCSLSLAVGHNCARSMLMIGAGSVVRHVPICGRSAMFRSACCHTHGLHGSETVPVS